MIEKRVPVNKEILVRTTENSILAQATTLGTAGGNNSNDSKSSGGGRENGGKNEEHKNDG